MERPTQFFDAYLFDLDGTIFLGDELLPGAARLVGELRRRRIPVRFLSNNATKAPEQYAEKLTRLGLPTDVADIANTVATMTRWLLANHPGKVVFPIAEQPIVDAFRQAGIAMSDDPAEIDVVVASYDRGFDYRKLQIAFDAIWFHRRAILVATNPDKYCPFPGGRGEPDCAAIVAAIEACTGTKCVQTVGKPDPSMVAEALRGLDVDPARCVMVGDRLATDIQMAVRAGMPSAMTLTGDSTLDDVAAADPVDRPSYVLERIDELVPADVWAELGWAS
ncbi:HAD-IIA family hydrolase [Tessaracoccus terricola]